MSVTQSQYAQEADFTSLSVSAQQAARFGPVSIVAALKAASSRADSYLASAFVLPLTSWDMQLTRVVCDMAAFDLYRQYGLNPSAPDFKALESLYAAAIEWLALVRDGKLTPQYEDSGGSPSNMEEGGPFVITATQRGWSERDIAPCNPPTVDAGPFSSD